MPKRISPFLSFLSIAVLGLLAAGCEDPVATPLASELDPQLAQAPADGFPVVSVRQEGAPPAGSTTPVVDDIAEAVAKVGAGGTIRVFPGSYSANGVMVDKPLTIEPASGTRPVIHVPGPAPGFIVDGVSSGTVSFVGLDFEVDAWTGILAGGTYDELVVQDGSFVIGLTAGVFVGSSTVSDARAVVRTSSFRGGALGVFASNAPRVDVLNSTFSDHGYSGIQYQMNASGRIEGNTLERCGPSGCIRVHAPVDVEVVGNEIRNEAGRHVSAGITAFAGGTVTIEDNDVVGVSGPGEVAFEHGIAVAGGTDAGVLNNRVGRAGIGIRFSHASGRIVENLVDPCGVESCININETPGPVQVAGNVLRGHLEFRTFFGINSISRPGQFPLSVTGNLIEGVGEPVNRNDPSTWPLQIAFQHNSWDPGQGGARGPAADFSGNDIVRSEVGVRAFHGGVVEGTDNTFDVLFGEVLGAHDRSINRIQRSDITDYQQPLATSDSGVLSVVCNWWGRAAGPQGVDPHISPAAYTPWATSPIAGTGATGCSGGL